MTQFDEPPTVVDQLRSLPPLEMPDHVIARLEAAFAIERTERPELLDVIDLRDGDLEAVIAAEYLTGRRRRRSTG